MSEPLKIGTKVKLSDRDWFGEVVSNRIISEGKEHPIMVMLKKSDNDPKEWEAISPAGGLCVYRVFDTSQLETIQ